MGIDLLNNKRVLVVDDEVDVLETIEDLLSMCQVVKASTFAEAKKHLDNRVFDIAILDIMGVDGYRLLEIADQEEDPAGDADRPCPEPGGHGEVLQGRSRLFCS